VLLEHRAAEEEVTDALLYHARQRRVMEAHERDHPRAYMESLERMSSVAIPNLADTLTTAAEQDAEEQNLDFLRRELDEGQNTDDDIESRRRTRRNVNYPMLGGRRYTPAQLRELADLDDRVDHIAQQGTNYDGWAPEYSEDEDDSIPDLIPALPTLADQEALRRDESLRDRMRMRRWRDHFAAQAAEGSRNRQYDISHVDPAEEREQYLVPRAAQAAAATLTAGRERYEARRATLVEATVAEERERYRARRGTAVEQHERYQAGPNNSGVDPSLRTTAMLQAVRRNNQFSNHSRLDLQRYIYDRESGALSSEDSDRTHPPRPNAEPSASQQRRSQLDRSIREEIQNNRNLLAEHRNHRANLEEQLRQQERHGAQISSEERRRRMWTLQTPCPPADKRSLDATINYLSSLQLCESDDEALETAVDNDIDRDEWLDTLDFLLDTTLIPAPPFSSYLQVGGILSGTQHAASGLQWRSQGRRQSDYRPSDAAEFRSRIRHPTLSTTVARTTSPNSPESTPPRTRGPRPDFTSSEELRRLQDHYRRIDIVNRPHTVNEERWPVKVKVHSIDYDAMTLTGTMEAFNVPDASSPATKLSITTYLEGEIIDFNNFALETKTFEAGTRVDGTYWRKLPPFKDLKDEETMMRCLLSKQWLHAELMDKWILMRWKGLSPFLNKSTAPSPSLPRISLPKSPII